MDKVRKPLRTGLVMVGRPCHPPRMSHKRTSPPPRARKSRKEPERAGIRFGFYATRGLVPVLALVLFLLPSGAGQRLQERQELVPTVPALEAPKEIGPVVDQPFTTDSGRGAEVMVSAIPGTLPAPARNQLPVEKCEEPARALDGGCWLMVGDVQPPCDPSPGKSRKMWPKDGRCWMPVFEAKKTPTSSEPRGGGVSVADP